MIGTGRRLQARTRLTLWYTLLLAGTWLALGSLGLWATGRALYASADELLRSKVAGVLSEVEFERGRLVVELATEPDGDTAALTAGLDLVRVWDRNRRVVFRQESKPDLPGPDPAVLEAILAGQRPSALATVRTPVGEAVRTHAEPVRDNDRIVGMVEVGRSEAEIEAVLTQLRALGVGGLLIALVLGWIGGWFVAGRALEPVDRITRAAEQIGAEDLSRRLDLTLPDDELGRLAAAFDAMIDRLDRAFRRQRQFTADASHELRTPLAIIRSQAEVALRQPRETAYYARILTSHREESERLERLTENLLVLARADAGESLVLAPLDLEELVAEAGARVAPRARARGVELGVFVGTVGLVRGDADWITQLLLNLLDNGLRHTPAGGRVTLSLEPAPDGACLRVADTGEGIAPEHLPRIFERFYRADQARARASGGTGLGLAICDWVARAHGGQLDVSSALGQGTTFTLWLPATAAADPAPGHDPTLPAEARPAPTT